VADIAAANGVLACEAALMGAESTPSIFRAMLALAEIQARDRKVAIQTQSAGLLSSPISRIPTISLSASSRCTSAGFLEGGGAVADLCGAEAGQQLLSARYRVRQHARRAERDVEAWADFNIKNHGFSRDSVVTHMRDEYSTFGWVIERMLTDVGFTLASADYHAPLHALFAAKPNTASRARAAIMKLRHLLAVMVAVIWGLAFVVSRIRARRVLAGAETALRFAMRRCRACCAKAQGIWPLLIAISGTLFLGQVSGAGLRHRPRRPSPGQCDRAEPGADHIASP